MADLQLTFKPGNIDKAEGFPPDMDYRNKVMGGSCSVGGAVGAIGLGINAGPGGILVGGVLGCLGGASLGGLYARFMENERSRTNFNSMVRSKEITLPTVTLNGIYRSESDPNNRCLDMKIEDRMGQHLPERISFCENEEGAALNLKDLKVELGTRFKVTVTP